MKSRALVGWMFVFSSFASGQTGIKLGITRAEVAASVGPIIGYYDAGTGNRLAVPPAVFIGPVFEIHTRKAGDNEFEININYAADQSGSRLHPEMRVARAFIRFDRPIKAMEVLKTLPEVAALCSSGCRMQEIRFKGYGLHLKGSAAAAVSRPSGPIEICVSDKAKTETIFLKFYTEKQDERDVSLPTSEVSEVTIEPFFDTSVDAIEATDAGVWQTPKP